MKNVLVITDTINLAKALERFFRFIFDWNCYYYTYGHSGTMSGDIYQKMDLFVFEVFRYLDTGFLRAEGVFILEKIFENKENTRKKVLLISGELLGEKINSPIYWDPASKISLKEKVEDLIKNEKIDYEKEIKKLKEVFKPFLTSPSHHGHKH